MFNFVGVNVWACVNLDVGVVGLCEYGSEWVGRQPGGLVGVWACVDCLVGSWKCGRA